MRKGGGERGRGRGGGKETRELEVSLEVPSFDAFSILMALTDFSIEM